jgi:hypothetical protein
LREERRLRVFENSVLRRIFGFKRDEVTGEWRKLHNEGLHILYPSPNIVEENNYMFRPLSGCTIIRLRLEYGTLFPKHCKTRSRSPILDVHIVVHEFSPVF